MYNGKFLNESKQAISRWNDTKLLEGISNPHTKAVTAILLDNQYKANNLRYGRLNEAMTDTSDVSVFRRMTIPMVRRVFPNLIANKVVSVQPLMGPVGLVHYLRYRYATNKGKTRGADLQGGYPADDAISLQQDTAGNATLDAYYSSPTVNGEMTSKNPGGSSSWLSNYAPLEHTPVIPGTVTGKVYRDGAVVQTFTVGQEGSFRFTDVGTQTVKAVSGGSSLDVNTGEIQVQWNDQGDPGENHLEISYEYNMECNRDIPELNLVLEDQTIEARPHKLKYVWSYEAQQDLQSQYNIDIEAEMTATAAQEINLEIDRTILSDLYLNAGTKTAWDYSTAEGDTVKEKNENLFVKMVEVSNIIHRRTMRGPANWIVTSPEIASMFETATAGFTIVPSKTFESAMGIQYVGTASTNMRIYKDPLFPTNQILMGYKGDSYLDSGYFFCPYIPLTETPVVLDTESFCPRKGLVVRAGRAMLRDGKKFYARIVVNNKFN